MKRDDSGFTLVELLIASVMFFVVLGALGTVMATASSSTETTRQTNDLNEQARLALNRITRELRQAQEIEDVKINGSGQITGLTFTIDLNGNGSIDSVAADPERLTYCWDIGGRRLLLTPDVGAGIPCDNPSSLPILSSDVQNLDLQLRSNLWQYDGDCPSTTPNGVVTWQELDCAPLSAGVGNQNGVLDTIELRNINGVSISLTVLTGARRQVYQTQVDMRNRA